MPLNWYIFCLWQYEASGGQIIREMQSIHCIYNGYNSLGQFFIQVTKGVQSNNAAKFGIVTRQPVAHWVIISNILKSSGRDFYFLLASLSFLWEAGNEHWKSSPCWRSAFNLEHFFVRSFVNCIGQLHKCGGGGPTAFYFCSSMYSVVSHQG